MHTQCAEIPCCLLEQLYAPRLAPAKEAEAARERCASLVMAHNLRFALVFRPLLDQHGDMLGEGLLASTAHDRCTVPGAPQTTADDGICCRVWLGHG